MHHPLQSRTGHTGHLGSPRNAFDRLRILHLALVSVLLAIVQLGAHDIPNAAAAERKKTAQDSKPVRDNQTSASKRTRKPKLTTLAAEMREMIAAAALRGELKELRVPIQWNELPPNFGGTAGGDPIAILKRQSADGSGLDVLAALLTVLSMPYTIAPLGADAENPNIYVFPYLADRDLSKLTARETLDLYRLLPAREAAAMIKTKRYTHWVVTIGADGTWHSFSRAGSAK
ncbi:MAG: hypothetical protein AAGC70_06905 [Pseudomonadota bacterium]